MKKVAVWPLQISLFDPSKGKKKKPVAHITAHRRTTHLWSSTKTNRGSKLLMDWLTHILRYVQVLTQLIPHDGELGDVRRLTLLCSLLLATLTTSVKEAAGKGLILSLSHSEANFLTFTAKLLAEKEKYFSVHRPSNTNFLSVDKCTVMLG